MSIHQTCHNCSRCSEEVYLFEAIRYSRWLPMHLIGWNNFNVSRTTACEVARFVRNVLLGVFKKLFPQNDSKSHRASLSCDWHIFFPKLSPQTCRKCSSMGSEEVFFEKIRILRQLCRDMFYLFSRQNYMLSHQTFPKYWYHYLMADFFLRIFLEQIHER